MNPKRFFGVLVFIIAFDSCKKDDKADACSPSLPTIRQIVNQQAVIKITGTISGVYLVEQGAIDSRLIPCNLPQDFYQNDLQVVVSGQVKAHPGTNGPCCTGNLYITKISR